MQSSLVIVLIHSIEILCIYLDTIAETADKWGKTLYVCQEAGAVNMKKDSIRCFFPIVNHIYFIWVMVYCYDLAKF